MELGRKRMEISSSLPNLLSGKPYLVRNETESLIRVHESAAYIVINFFPWNHKGCEAFARLMFRSSVI